MNPDAARVDPHDTLYVPMRRRFTSEYVTTPEGLPELRLFSGFQEVSFDEPELFPFGERLISQDTFLAGEATTWSTGAPHAWARVRALLEALLSEGLLSREPLRAATESDYHRGLMETEARRKAPPERLWWNPDCPRVMEYLTGRPLELGFLEAVLPVHRIAHPAFDREGRHVGEANVFPEALRMKLETEYRTCFYPGSRYRNDALMNVTALKAMTRYWKPVLHGVRSVRAEFVRRYPRATEGRWRMGDLHAGACAVLALPTWLLMRADAPVANGELDPVLSSMFRVTDGVRMVMAYLLFLPEAPMTYDTPISAAELFRIVEHDNHFVSNRGVCAGPQPMVEELLATLMDGKPVAGDPPPPEWSPDIPAAVDYALLGIQLYCVQFNLWGHMGRAYEVLHTALAQGEAAPGSVWHRLRERVERDWQFILPTRLDLSPQREWAEARYVELFAHAREGLRAVPEDVPRHLAEAFTPARDAVDARARAGLRQLLLSRLGPPADGPRRDTLEVLTEALAEFLAIERSALRALEGLQRQVNVLLRRPHPSRAFTGEDLALHHRLRTGTMGVLPDLLALLREELGITIDNTADATLVVDSQRSDSPLSPHEASTQGEHT